MWAQACLSPTSLIQRFFLSPPRSLARYLQGRLGLRQGAVRAELAMDALDWLGLFQWSHHPPTGTHLKKLDHRRLVQ
jgi:hypothetical protein